MKNIIATFILLTILIFSYTTAVFIYSYEPMPQLQTESETTKTKLSGGNFSIYVPAIDNDGKGAIGKLSVEYREGSGRTLVDIDQVFFWADTQNSIRTAKKVAENLTGMDLSKYDLIYMIESNASAVEGESAGAAMAVATIMMLKGETPKKDVTITGTILSNGLIGPASGILAKAKAAKDNGMEAFLVPHGQKIQTSYTKEKTCDNYLITTYCRTDVKEEVVDIESTVDIKVYEVMNINEALSYFNG